MADIFRVNTNLPRQDQIDEINEMVLQLEGLIEKSRFDINELDNLFDILSIARKFNRNVSLGNTIATFTGWSHLKEETGYSIWKFTPSNYRFSSLNQLYFDDKVLESRGEALTESATAFDQVLLSDAEAISGQPDFIDNTAEAATETGTEFELMDSTDDFLFIGLDSTFAGIKFEFQTRGSAYLLNLEYFNGSSGDGFQQLLSTTDDLIDDTNEFASDGRINWTIPSDWQQTSINGVTKFWIRISTTQAPTTVANAFFIIPSDSVVGLLALSSTEILEEDFAWCSFGTSIYATIRNQAEPGFEGDLFINSSSSSQNLQNFFVFNHEFTLDHLSSLDSPVSIVSGETIAVGNVVFISGEFQVSLADASDATRFAHAFASSVVGDTVQIRQNGILQNAITIGATDIIAGDQVFLSTTSGKITKTPGVVGVAVFQQVGIAISNESGGLVDILIDIEKNPATV